MFQLRLSPVWRSAVFGGLASALLLANQIATRDVDAAPALNITNTFTATQVATATATHTATPTNISTNTAAPTVTNTVQVPATATGATSSPSLTSTQLTVTLTATETATLISTAAPTNTATQTTVNSDWGMAGGNPARTSWTAEQIDGNVAPEWFKTFDAYIPSKVQIIAADGKLFISTSVGLYALNATTGAELWVYATELPLGNSPTVVDDVVYVAGFDKKLHAIDINTGAEIWTFTADAGFQTNPLVVNDIVYLGNRDGAMYAVNALDGTLLWKYQTAAPVLYSAAYANNTVYFASNDNYAYALNADTGALVWQSAKLPGAGFSSWWPVIYEDKVIFSGSNNYRTEVRPGPASQMTRMELQEMAPDYQTDARGTLFGSLGTEAGGWVTDTVTMDASSAKTYLENKPWRQTVFVLNQSDGQQSVTAPILWTGTHSGTRYPPVLGSDGVLYQQNSYMSDAYIAGGHITGWKPGEEHVSIVSSDWTAVDEPLAYVAGGDNIYWNLCCDREAGFFDITQPNTTFANRYNAGTLPATGEFDTSREIRYFAYNLGALAPGYDVNTYTGVMHEVFGDSNGVYGNHGDNNPLIPYNGKLYFHRGNSVIALSPTGGGTALPKASNPSVPANTQPELGNDVLQTMLAEEVQNILDAGHLRPGYQSHGLFDSFARYGCGDDLVDYFSNPSETIYTLLWALDYLPPAMVADVEAYLQTEFTSFPLYSTNHIGWQSGAARERVDLPPETIADMATYQHNNLNYLYWFNGGYEGRGAWGLNPYNHYVLWKYAEHFGNPDGLFAFSRDSLHAAPDDEVLQNNPDVLNAFIAGYYGYLELQKLAGETPDATYTSELARFWQLKQTSFTANTAYASSISHAYCNSLNDSANFMYLVPEIADFMRANLASSVQSAVTNYDANAPYWFVSFTEEGVMENAVMPLQSAHSRFMAQAQILGADSAQLETWLDVPAFKVGDLYYIQKLIATMESRSLALDAEDTALTLALGGTVTTEIALSGVGTSVAITATTDAPGVTLTLDNDTFVSNGVATLTVTHDGSNAMASQGPWVIEITGTSNGETVSDTVSLTLTSNAIRRVNVPFTQRTVDGGAFDTVMFPDGAIFWFGGVEETANYADARMVYNADALYVRFNVMDRLIWCATVQNNGASCENTDPANLDAISLYINTGGNIGSVPTPTSYRFVAQFAHEWMRNSWPTAWQHLYQGDGAEWQSQSADSFRTLSHYRGTGNFNTGQDSHGWWVAYEIPWSELGLSGPPAIGDTFGMAVELHDRDDVAGTAIVSQDWPDTPLFDEPQTWGELVFGVPQRFPPQVSNPTTLTLQHGVNNVTFSDVMVGGYTDCGAHTPDFFNDWGVANYANPAAPQSNMYLNIQGQEDVADWNCQSKVYMEIPLDQLPADKPVESAILTLNQFGNAGQGYPIPPDPSYIQVMTVERPWDEGAVTWNNAPLAFENHMGITVDPLDVSVYPNWYADTPLPHTFDVALAVEEAQSNGTPLRLVLYSADLARHSGKYFWSSEAVALDRIPKLEIVYGDEITAVLRPHEPTATPNAAGSASPTPDASNPTLAPVSTAGPSVLWTLPATSVNRPVQSTATATPLAVAAVPSVNAPSNTPPAAVAGQSVIDVSQLSPDELAVIDPAKTSNINLCLPHARWSLQTAMDGTYQGLGGFYGKVFVDQNLNGVADDPYLFSDASLRVDGRQISIEVPSGYALTSPGQVETSNCGRVDFGLMPIDRSSLNTVPQGAVQQCTDDRLRVIRTEGSLPANAYIVKYGDTNPANYQAFAGHQFVRSVCEVQASNEQTQFEQPLYVCIRYSDADLLKGGGRAENLLVGYWNGVVWEPLSEAPDVARVGEVCGLTDHFTRFGVLAVAPNALPTTGQSASNDHNNLLLLSLVAIGMISLLSRKASARS